MIVMILKIKKYLLQILFKKLKYFVGNDFWGFWIFKRLMIVFWIGRDDKISTLATRLILGSRIKF